MANRIITISREFGSGGRTVGKLTAEKLGIRCYDSELIGQIAQKSGFAESYVRDAGEYAPSGFWSPVFFDRTLGPTNQDQLWNIQYHLIRELAQKESCVIVGRCADFILRDQADCLRVFIYASMDFRAHRIVSVYGERKEKPEQRLRDKDKRRAAYYRFYTDQEWGETHNYHICLDTSALGIDRCAQIIASLY